MTNHADDVVGSWRAGYAPGDWLVLAGPAALVAVPPTVEAEELWPQVLAAASIDDLVEGLAGLIRAERSELAVFFWADGQMRTLIRGQVRVTDHTGAVVVEAEEGVQTWSERGLGDLRQVTVALAGDVDRPTELLPLVVGAVRASALTIDASDSALVLSPQLSRSDPATPVAPAPAARSAGVSPAPAPSQQDSAALAEAPGSRAVEEDNVSPPVASEHGVSPVVPAAVAGAAAAASPHVEGRRESATVPEPEAARPYSPPEREPNGATSPQVEATSAPTDPVTTTQEIPQTVIGPASSDAGAPGTEPIGHLRQLQFGGAIPDTARGLVDIDDPEGSEALDGPAGESADAQGEVAPWPGPAGSNPVQATDQANADAGHRAAAEDGEVVLAVLCANQQHPNPPDQSVCRWCHGPIERQRPQTIAAPVLAILVPSSGDPVRLHRTVVVGRAPSAGRSDDEAADLLTVSSPSQDISRSHLQVSPEGWDVTVTDLQSTNGTIVIPPGTEAGRRRLPPGQPVTIEIGSVLDLGDGVTIEVAAPV